MNRTGTVAEEFRKLRSEPRPAKARQALQWARNRVDASAFYYRADNVTKYRTSFCNEDGADVYQLASVNGRLRVELAFVPDYDHERDEPESADDFPAMLAYFRNHEKLGRNAAHLAATRAIRNLREALADDSDVETYGIMVRVFWDTPELEAGEPIGEAACWGFTDNGDNDSAVYRWDSARDLYREAMHGVCETIRKLRRDERKALMIEAFQANFSI